MIMSKGLREYVALLTDVNFTKHIDTGVYAFDRRNWIEYAPRKSGTSRQK